MSLPAQAATMAVPHRPRRDQREAVRLRAISALASEGFLGASKAESGDLLTTSDPCRGIANLPGLLTGQPSDEEISTALMELFRVRRSGTAFNLLVEWTRPSLLARVRARCRFLGVRSDAEELLQDAYINIFRYPDRFQANRPGAFHAWAFAVVDNAIRRSLRKSQAQSSVSYQPTELLVHEADDDGRQPAGMALRSEAWHSACQTFSLFLMLYLQAYEQLADRERHVLHQVEVEGLRYADVAGEMGIRPEALKMVVFRARRRMAARIRQAFAERTVQAA